MSFPPVDQSTLSNLSPNLEVGQIADPSLRLLAFQYLYGKLTEIINTLNSSTFGTSGADNISSAAINGLNSMTIYAQLAEIEAQIQSIQSGVVPSSSITSIMIQNLAIITSKLADLAVTTGKLADGAVTLQKNDANGQIAYLGGLTYAYKNLGGYL